MAMCLWNIFLVLCVCCISCALGGSEINTANISSLTAEKMLDFISKEAIAPGRPFRDRAWWCSTAEKINNPQALSQSVWNMASRFKVDLSDESWMKRPSPWNLPAITTLLERMLVIEGIEFKGRFTPRIFDLIRQICKARTWVEQYHDSDRFAFSGKGKFCELNSARCGYVLALASWLYGDAMPSDLHREIFRQVNLWLFEPYREFIRQGKPGHGMWWIQSRHNWNPACHSMVAGAAMILIDSPQERARFLSEIIRQSMLYIEEYPEDGYCGEGMDYWRYGFGRYLILAELIYLETRGKVDLYNGIPKLEKIKRFGVNLRLSGGVIPTYSDCPPDSSLTPYASLLYLRGGCLEYFSYVSEQKKSYPAWSIITFLITADQISRVRAPVSIPETELVHYFDNAGVVSSRAAKEDAGNFSLGLKFGHNGESHNHNDVGSFVVAFNGIPIVLDPGCPIYDYETFTDKRYQNDVLNSYGHPVPVVNGLLQMPGRQYSGKIESFANTPERMVVSGELAGAYPREAGLKYLKRTFVHDRKAREITVTDEFEFETPGNFHSALFSFEPVTVSKTFGTYWIGRGKHRTRFQFHAIGGPLGFQQGGLKYKVRGNVQPVRFQYGFRDKLRKGKISVTISPDPESGI